MGDRATAEPGSAPASSSGTLPSGTSGPSDFAPRGEQCDAVSTRHQQVTGVCLRPGTFISAPQWGAERRHPWSPGWEFWRWNHVSIRGSPEHAGLWQNAGRTRASAGCVSGRPGLPSPAHGPRGTSAGAGVPHSRPELRGVLAIERSCHFPMGGPADQNPAVLPPGPFFPSPPLLHHPLIGTAVGFFIYLG